jgi:hypothetical protein
MASRDAVNRAVIPVRVSFEDMLLIDPGATMPLASVASLEGMERRSAKVARQKLAAQVYAQLVESDPMAIIYDAIRLSVLRSLASQPWELALGRAHYGTLVGARSQDDESLNAQRRRLTPYFAGNDTNKGEVAKLAPDLPIDDAANLVRALNSDRRSVRISLQFDLSPSPWGRVHDRDEGEELLGPYVTVLRQFGQALKNLDEENARSKPPTLPSLVDQMLFISPAGLDIFLNEFVQQPEIIDFDWYRPIQVFAILAHHFPPQHAAPGVLPTDRLSAIMPEHAFREVDQTMGLNTAMEILEQHLMRDMSDPDTVTYRAILPQSDLEEMLQGIVDRLDRLESHLGLPPMASRT